MVQCQTDATSDSKGETVGAGRRVVAELRTGGRLGFFATGGRLVERERPEEDVLSLDDRADDKRDEFEREEERDDDGVAWDRVRR